MYIKVRIIPEAKKESISRQGDVFLISVKEPAKQNLANKRLKEILALYFSVPIGKIKLISGHHNRSKIVSVEDIDGFLEDGIIGL